MTLNRLALIAASALATAALTLIPAPASAEECPTLVCLPPPACPVLVCLPPPPDRATFPGPGHPCLQAPCPPTGDRAVRVPRKFRR